jgi:hypothetical protein
MKLKRAHIALVVVFLFVLLMIIGRFLVFTSR